MYSAQVQLPLQPIDPKSAPLSGTKFVITALHSVTLCQVQLLHQKHIKLPIINYLGIFLGVIIPSTYLATLSKNSLVLDTLTTFHIN